MNKTEQAMMDSLKANLAKAEADLKSKTDSLRYSQIEVDRLRHEVDSVHASLDVLGVPRKITTESWSPDMTIASRLFAWQAGAKSKPSQQS